MFVLIFYATSPIPSIFARRYADNVEASSVLIEVCLFITTGIVISAYGLPIVLAHLHIVSISYIIMFQPNKKLALYTQTHTCTYINTYTHTDLYTHTYTRTI